LLETADTCDALIVTVVVNERNTGDLRGTGDQ
jgi:hypothetical protein